MRWQAEIERLQRSHRHRALALPGGVDFTSNDYLGLAHHPALREALIAALERDGVVGAGGSRLLRGHHEEHARLETFAAAFFGAEKSLYFGSGFLPIRAVHDACGSSRRGGVRRAHSCLGKGRVHASPAERYRARHNDLESYAAELKRARERGARQVFVAAESVYSMDGDLRAAGGASELAQIDATLVVDEAHATGVSSARPGIGGRTAGRNRAAHMRQGAGRCRRSGVRVERNDRLPHQQGAAVHLFDRAAAVPCRRSRQSTAIG
jgi:8-amino-7-oxononanoate synthase